MDQPTAPRPSKTAAGLKLLVPTSFSRKSVLALEHALTLSTHLAGQAEVYLFHTYDQRKTDFSRLDKINEACVERMRMQVLEAIEILRVRGIDHNIETVHRRLSYGKAWLEILKVAGGISADMIIMGAPSSSAFGKLIEQAPCTLVLVKDKDTTFIVD